MIIKTKALVIREYTIGESDKYITLFTKEIGKIEVLAPKAKMSQHGLASSTQLFVYGDFLLAEYKDTYKLMNVEIIEMFHAIRENLMALSYASYIMEFVQSVTQPNLVQNEMLRLTLMTLRAFTKKEDHYKRICHVFEVRAMAILGFMLELNSCTCCGKVIPKKADEINYFSAEQGGIICRTCKEGLEMLPIHYATRYTLDYILHAPLKELFAFKLSEEVLKELHEVCKRYVAYYIDKRFKTLEFINRLEEL